jgi:DNA-binding beta-propeller fold protein YncE
VINTATCNARHTAGCAAPPPTIAVGPFPDIPVLNPATRTMYVGYGDNANRIAVINIATCNATGTSGCGQAPGVVKVPQGTFNFSVSVKADTLYAATTGFSAPGHTVAVINGAACNGTNHTGCGHLAATATVGLFPEGSAVNDRTHTLYVANNFNGDAPGTLSIINTATCNGTHTAGCHRHFPAVATGRAPVLVAVDTRTGVVYTTDFGSAALSILNGTRCNATVTTCCRTREQPVGSGPLGIAIDPAARTVYVTNIFPGLLRGTSVSIVNAG